MKKILFVASECVPFVKTGGLADVCGSLPKAFDKNEYDIRVIIPNYHAIKEEWRNKMENVYYFQMDDRVYVGIKTLTLDGIQYYFVDNEQYFNGLVPYYDMFQDLERFAYFSKAVLSALPLIGFRPDIIHCHDWQSGLVPVYLNTQFQGNPFYRGIRTIFTIHNIRFQGTWNVGYMQWITKLPWECFQPGKLVSPYQNTKMLRDDWDCSMMRGGIVYSDYVTTVSNSYAYEIQTPEFGEGLEDILKWRRERLWGIVNGIDTEVWNPATDKKIYQNYNIKTQSKGKKANKVALQKELGLPENPDVLTLGIISRLTDQKGLDLVNIIMDELCGQREINLIVLGTGASNYEDMFRYFENKYPGKVRAKIMYSDELSHKIYAGVDALMVPSAFEPCGLTQMIALRYGTVPIVHAIGGLKDTVEPYNEVEETGTGFSFKEYSAWALMDRINHACWLYYDKPESWKALVERGMSHDWSWANSSKIYMDLYNRL